MATLATVSRQRKADLRQLMKESRRVDAAQEALEREVKRVSVRKTAVPELADAERILQLAITLDTQVATFSKALKAMSQAWRTS